MTSQKRQATQREMPTVVAEAARVAPPEQQTARMRREQAFAADDRWVGYVRSEPGDWSGWHHHGETDTYFYVVRGKLQLECGTDQAVTGARRGDFVHVPAHVIHRERTAGEEPAEIVLVRMGRGPTVVNVEGPPS
jgi:mannose-6-phosphate isomerase-like protein (cupin superfamily)